ncbi:MAG: ABC transporter substrate-binding protein [Dehalococcoidia bacterium]
MTATASTSATTVDRRHLLKGSLLTVSGLAAAALLGCGSDDDTDVEATPSTDGPLTTTSGRPDTLPEGWIWAADLPYPYQWPDPSGTPKRGGVLRYASGYDISTFDPTKAIAGGTLQITNPVYNRLLGFVNGPRMNPFKLELTSELATSWERSPDGMTFTFKMTPGVKWQNVAPLNGRPFVAADVAYAYEAYRSGGPSVSNFLNADQIQAVDDTTLKITMKRPVADFLLPLAGRYLVVVPRELMDDGSIGTKAIGTGPMLLKDAQAGGRALFDRNPDYWAADVLLDGFEIRIIIEPAARLAAFRAGQVDYAYSFIQTPQEVKNLLGTNPDIQVQISPLTSNTFTFALNLSMPKFQDDRVRQALSLAMDRELMVTLLGEGVGRSLPVIPWDFVFDEEPTTASGQLGEWWTHDPTKAKQLLSAAGADGLTINSTYYQYGLANTRGSEAYIDQLRAVGVTLNNRSVDYTEFNSQWTTGKLAEATTSGWQAAGYDADNYFYNQIYSKSPGNRNRINDPQIDQWAEEQQLELDPAARRAIHRKIWDHEMKKMYRITFPQGFAYNAYQASVRGIRTGGRGTATSYDDGTMVESAWLDK